MPLGPAQVHPQQHGSEVGCIDAARLGADGDQRVALVVLAGQQCSDLEHLDRLLQGRELFRASARLAASSFFLPKFDQHAEVVQPGAQSN